MGQAGLASARSPGHFVLDSFAQSWSRTDRALGRPSWDPGTCWIWEPLDARSGALKTDSTLTRMKQPKFALPRLPSHNYAHCDPRVPPLRHLPLPPRSSTYSAPAPFATALSHRRQARPSGCNIGTYNCIVKHRRYQPINFQRACRLMHSVSEHVNLRLAGRQQPCDSLDWVLRALQGRRRGQQQARRSRSG